MEFAPIKGWMKTGMDHTQKVKGWIVYADKEDAVNPTQPELEPTPVLLSRRAAAVSKRQE